MMLFRGVGDECSEPSRFKACSHAAKFDRRLKKQAAAVFFNSFAARLGRRRRAHRQRLEPSTREV